MSRPERWAPIAGAPGYLVSDRGRVRGSRGGILSPDRGNRGHLRVAIYRGGRRSIRWVHVLVLEAFGRPKPPGEWFALHRDDDRANNTPANLYWGSRIDNAEDARRNGRTSRGARHPRSKLSPSVVADMRRRYLEGESAAALGREAGVSRATASAAIRGDTWAEVA